jgi:hypothetical protein
MSESMSREARTTCPEEEEGREREWRAILRLRRVRGLLRRVKRSEQRRVNKSEQRSSPSLVLPRLQSLWTRLLRGKDRSSVEVDGESVRRVDIH